MYPVEGHEFDLAEEDFAQPAGLSLGDAFPGIELAEESLTGGRSGQQFAISEEELARPAGLSLSDAFPGLELEEEADSIAEQDAATAASSESGEEQPVAGSRKKFRREIETRCNAPADTDWSPLAAREITAEEIFKVCPSLSSYKVFTNFYGSLLPSAPHSQRWHSVSPRTDGVRRISLTA
jgi:hypothetical protein